MTSLGPRNVYPIHFMQYFIAAAIQPVFTCSKLVIETLKQGVKYVQSVFIVNFEYISYHVLVFLLLTLNM